MDVVVAGAERSWTRQRYTLSECVWCGSRDFKRSRLTGLWWCRGCNEAYDEKPWFPVLVCSRHGVQLRYSPGDEGYWCIECEDEDWLLAWRARGS